jgi:Cu/Ag efflux protein CusF
MMTSTVRTSTLVLGTVLSLSAMAFAAAETTASAAALANSAPQVHTAKGSVKFVDSSTLVIHQISPYSGRNMTFVMRPSTEREGDLKAGSTVTVRYENEPDHRVATVVEVEHAKVSPSTSPSH